MSGWWENLIQLEWHDNAQTQDNPEGTAGQNEELSPSFAGCRGEPETRILLRHGPRPFELIFPFLLKLGEILQAP